MGWLGPLVARGVTDDGLLEVKLGEFGDLRPSKRPAAVSNCFLSITGRMSRLRVSIFNATRHRLLLPGPNSSRMFPCILLLARSSSTDIPLLLLCLPWSVPPRERVLRRWPATTGLPLESNAFREAFAELRIGDTSSKFPSGSISSKRPSRTASDKSSTFIAAVPI